MNRAMRRKYKQKTWKCTPKEMYRMEDYDPSYFKGPTQKGGLTNE